MTLKDLGVAYRSAKNYPKAEEMLKRSHGLNCLAVGAECRSSLDIFVELVALYEEMLDKGSFIPHLEELYALQCKVLGEKHFLTLKTLRKLEAIRCEND